MTGGQVVRVRRLRGATSSVLHDLTIASPRGAHTNVVLRRYLHPAWIEAGPELIRQEAIALAAAATAPVTAPDLVAADPTGELAHAPALAMTRLPGRPVVTPRAGWLDAVAGVHRAMAAWRLPSTVETLPPYSSWIAPDVAPPPWTSRPKAWARAIAIAGRRLPPHRPPQPIHRDLHPGNVTLVRGRATGVVDWVNACVGPFESDLAHCRVNLTVLAGLDAADAFLAATGEAGQDLDPAWDLVVALGLLPDPSALRALNELGASVTRTQVRERLDELVGRAVATHR